MFLKELSVVYFQMKERELDYKKSMDQLLKDKDDANRQLKMMQEGEEFDSVFLLICIIIFWVTMLKNKFHQCFLGMLIMYSFISLHGASS
jgi:hypothetical protein